MFNGTWYFVTEIQFRSICFHVRKILITPVLFSGGHFFFRFHCLNMFLICMYYVMSIHYTIYDCFLGRKQL